MASTPAAASKGTRKTYSFEEREILVNLIYKYLIDGEEGKTTPDTCTGSGTKKKSAWSQLTEEYNSIVGSENSRSSVQLRRCWENMKANKKNRDDKRPTDHLQLPSATMSLPPNVMFQPTDSEPFTFEGLLPSTFQKESNADSSKDIASNGNVTAEPEPMESRESSGSMDDMLIIDSVEDPPAKKMKKKSPKKQMKQQKITKYNKIPKNEMYEYSISEAQLKLDTAALLKEEAKLKLEEAEYRKEEARMRMICANYKLQKLREECQAAIDDRTDK